MPRISVTEANQALVNTGWSFISLHTDDPGTTGANEVSGAGYSRASITWNTASGGSRTNSNAIAITIPAGTTVTYFGLWSASTAGTYYIGGLLTPSVTASVSTSVTFATTTVSISAS
jgi:hypothetical protein